MVVTMTDNEIVKALECCGVDPNSGKYADCKNCPLDTLDDANCFYFVIQQHALDLINRQKAEIESLREIISVIDETLKKCAALANAEAIKEFAERLKAEGFHHKNFGDLVQFEDIDALVKEMTEEIQ